MNQQRLIQAAVPAALFASSVLEDELVHPQEGQHVDPSSSYHHHHHHAVAAAAVATCTNDHAGSQQDTGCPATAPICVDPNGKEPAAGQAGSDCVPCLNYYDNPAQPDWGCSESEPLCVITTTTTTTTPAVVQEEVKDDDMAAASNNNNKHHTQQARPEFGSAGTTCIPYPCHNTAISPDEPDAGCTTEYPACVDGLGNHPPLNQPGIQCIAYLHHDESATTTADTTMPVFDDDNDNNTPQNQNQGIERSSRSSRNSNHRHRHRNKLTIPSAWGILPKAVYSPRNLPTTTTTSAAAAAEASVPEMTTNNNKDQKKGDDDDDKGCWNTTGHFNTCTGCPFSTPKIAARPCALGRLSW